MRILILGATGAAGGALLDAALEDPHVSEVRAITRRALPPSTPRLRGYVHDDLLSLGPVADAFTGIDACFFCVGRSVTQVPDEAQYRHLVQDLALSAATATRAHSPDAVFHYLSGQGASATSAQMWARVKFDTEQLLRAQFAAVCWRPGAIDAVRQDGWPQLYRIVIPLLRVLAPLRSVYIRGSDLALAMLAAAATRQRDRVYENREIRALADAARGRGPPA